MQATTNPGHETSRKWEHLRPSNPCAGTAVSKGADAHIFMKSRMPRRGGRHGVTQETTVDAKTMKIQGSSNVPNM
eukprot:9699041-Karenia_brevis.AAC.1